MSKSNSYQDSTQLSQEVWYPPVTSTSHHKHYIDFIIITISAFIIAISTTLVIIKYKLQQELRIISDVLKTVSPMSVRTQGYILFNYF